jgi:hypothetical protein
MRSKKWLLLLAVCTSGAALARSEKPIIGPAPDWVKPLALPAMPEKGDDAPVRFLLSDEQTRMEPGRIASYVDLALHIQTPQGLAAGNLSFPWNPETDEITVHKLLIHRDGKIIDVLADGQTFTIVRREPNLESAMLDGMLTANIQPEGLQVGDVLEYRSPSPVPIRCSRAMSSNLAPAGMACPSSRRISASSGPAICRFRSARMGRYPRSTR